MSDFRRFRVIKTKHSKERMEERNISDYEINYTIKYGVVLEENTLFHNNLYLIYDINKEKRLLIIITLIKGKEHLLTSIEKDIIVKLNKLIDNTDSNTIKEELTNAYNDFMKGKSTSRDDDPFNFTDLLNYTDPFIINNWKNNIIYNQDKKSIVMNVLMIGNLHMLDILISDYSVDVGIVKKVYSTVFRVIKKFENKSGQTIEQSKQIEESTYNFIKSLEFIVSIYNKNNQGNKIEEMICSKSSDGYTPLMMSLYKGLDNLSCFLIQNGANISMNESNFNKRGESIQELCSINSIYLEETIKMINSNLHNST